MAAWTAIWIAFFVTVRPPKGASTLLARSLGEGTGTSSVSESGSRSVQTLRLSGA